MSNTWNQSFRLLSALQPKGSTSTLLSFTFESISTKKRIIVPFFYPPSFPLSFHFFSSNSQTYKNTIQQECNDSRQENQQWRLNVDYAICGNSLEWNQGRKPHIYHYRLPVLFLSPFMFLGEREIHGWGVLHTYVTSYSQIQLKLRKEFNAPRFRGTDHWKAFFFTPLFWNLWKENIPLPAARISAERSLGTS